jgi:coenzyme F420-reducing hydrogenase delta subunit
MAEKRVEYARGLLDEIHMGADRLRMERGEELSSLQMIALVQNQADAVRALGPNPMKGAKKR